jgi:DNA gyrase subunit B
MDPDQLWKTAMDPKNRQFLQIDIEDAESADQTFSVLMGDDANLEGHSLKQVNI